MYASHSQLATRWEGLCGIPALIKAESRKTEALSTMGKIKVVIIGGGISGIASGIRLTEALGDRLDLTVSHQFPISAHHPRPR